MATDSQSTTTTKKDLVDRIAKLTADNQVVVKKVIETFLDQITDELGKGKRLEFRDFGVFETRARAAGWLKIPGLLKRSWLQPSVLSGSRQDVL